MGIFFLTTVLKIGLIKIYSDNNLFFSNKNFNRVIKTKIQNTVLIFKININKLTVSQISTPSIILSSFLGILCQNRPSPFNSFICLAQ